MNAIKYCHICHKRLDDSADPVRTRDCGGDCLLCMAKYGLDPDCIDAMREIEGEDLWPKEE
jgi:hypothetical protein